MQYKMGVVGLGVMGASLARNIESKGFPVVGYDLDAKKTNAFLEGPAKGKAIIGVDRPERLMEALERPRRVLFMVPAGPPVDSVIAHLKPHLEEGDILIDGGNSYFVDTDRRSDELADAGFRFVGAGVSGGEEGALLGPAIMPGGPAGSLGGPGADFPRDRREGGRWRALRRPHGPARRRALREDGAQRHRVRRHAAHCRGLRSPPPRRRPDCAGARRRVLRNGMPASCAPIWSRSPQRSSSGPTTRPASRSST